MVDPTPQRFAPNCLSQTDLKNGMNDALVKRRLEEWGYNELPEKKVRLIKSIAPTPPRTSRQLSDTAAVASGIPVLSIQHMAESVSLTHSVDSPTHPPALGRSIRFSSFLVISGVRCCCALGIGS